MSYFCERVLDEISEALNADDQAGSALAVSAMPIPELDKGPARIRATAALRIPHGAATQILQDVCLAGMRERCV